MSGLRPETWIFQETSIVGSKQQPRLDKALKQTLNFKQALSAGFSGRQHMSCCTRRDLSTHLQLSSCLSALLNWGQHFSSPSVSLTLTMPDIKETQTGTAAVTYWCCFHPLEGGCTDFVLWVAGSGCPGHPHSPITPGEPHAP